MLVVEGGDSEIGRLWDSFRIFDDKVARDELISHYLYLVRSVTRRLPSALVRHWSVDDLEGFGSLGLIDAIDRHHGREEGVAFEPYALARIRGAIYDEFRKLDWLPRSSRRSATEFLRVEDTLRATQAHSPSFTEVLSRMGIEAGRAAEETLTAVRRSRFESLQAPFGDGESSRADQLVSEDDPENSVLDIFAHEELMDAINRLPERQRMIILLRYQTNLTQDGVAAELNVSHARIVALESRALHRLRNMLSEVVVARASTA